MVALEKVRLKRETGNPILAAERYEFRTISIKPNIEKRQMDSQS